MSTQTPRKGGTKKLKDTVSDSAAAEEEFTGKNLTRFGGAGLIRRFMDRLDVLDLMLAVGEQKRRQIDYSPSEICLCLLYAMMMGIFRPSHMMELVADKVFQKITGLTRFPTQSTLSAGFCRGSLFTRPIMLLDRIRNGFREIEDATLDIDSHVIPVFGSQHRAALGYNPKKQGRKGFHPLLCFLGETRDCLGGIFRPGNTTNHNVENFLKAMLRRFPDGTRMRRGFFSWDIHNRNHSLAPHLDPGKSRKGGRKKAPSQALQLLAFPGRIPQSQSSAHPKDPLHQGWESQARSRARESLSKNRTFPASGSSKGDIHAKNPRNSAHPSPN